MLKINIKENAIILETKDYIELFGAPKEPMSDNDTLVLARFIRQATDQFDSMVSTYNNAGALYKWGSELDGSEDDNLKGFKLQKAIGSGTETMIISGKFGVDNVPSMSSNISYNLNTSSNDSSIEAKRTDILKDLNAIGLLKTLNNNSRNQTKISDKDIDDLLITTKGYLTANFLGLDSMSFNQNVQSSINMSANSIRECGDITGAGPVGTGPTISNFIFKNVDIQGFQNKLIAGPNITLTPNEDNTTTIKASGGLSEVAWGSITGDLYDQTDLEEALGVIQKSKENKLNVGYGITISRPPLPTDDPTISANLIAGENITLTNSSGFDKSIIISATGGGTVDPNDPLLKGNFINVADRITYKPKNPLGMFDTILNTVGSGNAYASRAIIGYSSRIENNDTRIPKSGTLVDPNWSEKSVGILGGNNLIVGSYMMSEVVDTGGKYVFPYSITFDMNEVQNSNILKYYIHTDGNVANDGASAQKIRIYPETDPEVVQKLDAKQEKLTAGVNITISDDFVISAIGGGGAVDPNNPLLKNNFANVLGPNLLAPRQALNTGDILLNATSGKVTRETDELHSRVNIGWESRVDNNKNTVPTSTVFVDTNGDKLSAIVMGGINTIIGVNHVDGSSAEPAWDIVPANAITFDMTEVKSSNIIKYYKATSYGNNWGEVTNVRIYPETDPNIVALAKKVDGQLNDPDGINDKIIYFSEQIEIVSAKTNRAIMFYKSTVTTFINQNEFNIFKDTYNVREGDYLYVTTTGLIQVQGLKDMWNEFL